MKRYVIADLHFGHQNVIKYEDRPFKDAVEMDEKLIELWNSTVSTGDIVYVLGDFTLSRKLATIQSLTNRLNGDKILIMGNHDTRKPKDYVECGFKVAIRRPIMVDPGVILMHEPFTDSFLIALNYFYFFGHVHSKKTLMDEYSNCFCVSVERIGYKPIDLDKCLREMKDHIKQNKGFPVR